MSQARPEQAAGTTESQMTQYLISFGAHGMGHVSDEDAPAVARAARAAVQEAIKPACTCPQAGWKTSRRASWPPTGRSPTARTRRRSADSRSSHVPSREEALRWAAKIAVACRCAQEVRAIGADPELDAMLRQADSRR